MLVMSRLLSGEARAMLNSVLVPLLPVVIGKGVAGIAVRLAHQPLAERVSDQEIIFQRGLKIGIVEIVRFAPASDFTRC
ncbi:MAG TPA: hypothetical protein VNG51_16805 [Ktedonobacteraceae bacterium]|nr:hypothetical protein [Ktedonobacteraceae bacterium]